MARPMYASVLPCIKCSDCGADIEISMMGDHVCSGLPGAPTNAQTPGSNQDRAASPPFSLTPLAQAPALTEGPAPTRLSAMVYSPPLRIPRISITPQQTPAPIQSPERPTSPPTIQDIRQQDNQAIAHARAHSQTPRDGHPPRVEQRQVPVRSATEPMATPMRPPSEDLRLPQDSAFPVFPSKKGMGRQGAPPSLALNRSQSSLDVNAALISPSLNSPANVIKRMDTITSGPFGARARKNSSRSPPRSPAPPAEPSIRSFSPPRSNPPAAAPPRPPRPDTDDSLLEKLQGFSADTAPKSVIPSQTSFRRPSQPFANVPPTAQHDGHKTASPPPPGPAVLPLQAVKGRESPDQVAGPLPDLSSLHSQPSRKPSHTANSSSSSSGSRSMFGSRTESSRSSRSSPFNIPTSLDLPTKTSPVDREISVTSQPNDHNAQSNAEEFAFGQPSPLLSLTTSHLSNQHGQDYKAPHAHSFTAISPEPVDSPMEYSATRPRDETSTSPPRLNRPGRTPKAKGDCRGCGKPIIGKSIKAADGRLTGRYHKECFSCHSCKGPFDTAEFYVHNNHPYCAHHYHVANDSLCRACNTGIEGKYLETQPRQRYHLECFSCHDCRKPLTSDYYELNQRFYCEHDAFGAYDRTRLLSPGKRLPERRTTRLMMM